MCSVGQPHLDYFHLAITTVNKFPFFSKLALSVNGGLIPISFVDRLVSPGAPSSQKYECPNMGYKVLGSSVNTFNSISLLLPRLAIYVNCQVISASDNFIRHCFLRLKREFIWNLNLQLLAYGCKFEC